MTEPARRLRSPGFKLLIICLLTALMALPLLAIELALVDRQSRANDATTDVATGWGAAQTVAGPMLFVPYLRDVTTVTDGHAVAVSTRFTAVLLPSALELDTRANTSTRWRGIFPVPVYSAAVAMKARFDKEAIASMLPADATPLWKEAFVGIAISDVRGLADNVTVSTGGRSIALEPGLGIDGPMSGLHAPLGLDAAPETLTLSTNLALRGSRELNFAALGTQTTAHLVSNWRDPSFAGAFLPTGHRIGAEGFDATWNVPYLARGFGQSFATSDAVNENIPNGTFGVKLYQPVDFYQLVQRSLKYAILFVGLAFLVFFVTEMIAGQRLHAAQYLLMGSAQVLFYLLLLSFAEHIGFAWSYLLATGATVTLTALYAASAFGSWFKAGALFAVLSGLYGLLYVILVQEDYALLIGALVLFFALGGTMYVTRRIDWSRIAPEPGTAGP